MQFAEQMLQAIHESIHICQDKGVRVVNTAKARLLDEDGTHQDINITFVVEPNLFLATQFSDGLETSVTHQLKVQENDRIRNEQSNSL